MIGIIAVLVILLVIMISFGAMSLTGRAIMNEYTYTRAFCNETNFCQDYIVTCDDNIAIDLTPISGAMVQHRDDWEDPRDDTTLC